MTRRLTRSLMFAAILALGTLASCSGGGGSKEITITVLGPSTVCLSWDPSVAATEYEVMRDGVMVASLGLQLHYVDNCLVPGQTYTYQVRGFSPGGFELLIEYERKVRTLDLDSWSHEEIGSGRSASLAVCTAGELHAAWCEASGVLAVAERAGGAWASETVESGLASDCAPSLVLGTADEAHVAYSGPAGELRYATDASGAWAIETPTAALGPGVRETAITLDASGEPFIAFLDGSTVGVAYPNGAGWTIEVVHATTSFAQQVGIAFLPDGSLHVSYASSPTAAPDELSLYHSRKVASVWARSLVAHDVEASSPLSVTVNGTLGLAFIQLGRLQLARSAGTVWTTEDVEAIFFCNPRTPVFHGDVFLAPFAGDDFHIAYLTYSCELRQASPFAGGWTVDFVEAAVDAARSIVLDLTGRVHVAYDDAVLGAAKVASSP